jgi:tRNA dimethylallyltransferase
MQNNVIVILGPTASGKTVLAAHLAQWLNAEIISADSRQVYREMNIGTGKDYSDYIVRGESIPYHLIDIVNPGTKYHVHQFIQDAHLAFDEIATKNKQVILCGGTGMYIDALLNQYQYTAVPINQELRNILSTYTHEQLLSNFESMPEVSYTQLADKSTSKRLIRAIEICYYLQSNDLTVHPHKIISQPIIIGVAAKTTEQRRERIAERLEKRLQSGLIEEVKRLMTKIPEEDLIWYGLEYKFVVMHLQGKLSLAELKEKLNIAIRQFAKRQMTYFRKMESDGKMIHWIDASLPLNDQLAITSNIIHQLTAKKV